MGRMAKPEGLAVMAHLADCEDCRNMYDDVLEFLVILKQALCASESVILQKERLEGYSWDSQRGVFVIQSKN